jgi:hypothetical protein
MKGAAELAELRPKGRQTRDDCISEKGESKGFGLSEERNRTHSAADPNGEAQCLCEIGGHRADAIEFSRSLWGAMTNEMISREFDRSL